MDAWCRGGLRLQEADGLNLSTGPSDYQLECVSVNSWHIMRCENGIIYIHTYI